MDKRHHADLIVAWANGAKIERYYPEFADTRGGGWLQDELPRWANHVQYRIKDQQQDSVAEQPSVLSENVNERIRALDGLAAEYADSIVNCDECDHCGECESCITWVDAQAQKFTELIVAECVNIVYSHTTPYDAHVNAPNVVSSIKERFGVK